MTLVEQLDQGFDQYQTHITLSDMFQALKFTFTQFIKYRFLLLDFTGIMRRYSSIRAHYQSLYTMRQQQFLEAIRKLTEAGILRKDIDQQQYEHLAAHFNIVSDFWLPHAEILHSGDVVEHLSHFTRLTFSLLFPYLTPAGQREYQQLTSRPLS